MINVIIELSKYLILTLMILYTFQCFHMFRYTDEQEKRHLLRKQIMLTFFMNFTAFLNIYLITEDFEVILFYVEMTGLFAAVQILFRISLVSDDPVLNYVLTKSDQFPYGEERR